MEKVTVYNLELTREEAEIIKDALAEYVAILAEELARTTNDDDKRFTKTEYHDAVKLRDDLKHGRRLRPKEMYE